mgnify:CR=1 FL=1
MEAGAIIATFTDKSSSLHLANDFLLRKASGENVFTTVSETIKHAQVYQNPSRGSKLNNCEYC